MLGKLKSSNNQYHLWKAVLIVGLFDMLLDVFGLSWLIAAWLAPPNRYVGLYRDLTTDIVTNFDTALNRNFTHLFNWILKASLTIVFLRWMFNYPLLIGALRDSRVLLVPFLVWNFMTMIFVCFVFVTLNFVTRGLLAGQYKDFHFPAFFIIAGTMALMLIYQITVYRYMRQLFKRAKNPVVLEDPPSDWWNSYFEMLLMYPCNVFSLIHT